MSRTAVDICSVALSRLGCRRIASFEENSAEAQIASQIYPTARDTVLVSYPWSFSLAQNFLNASVSAEVSEFRSVFDLPQESIRVVAGRSKPGGRSIVYRILGRTLHTDESSVFLTFQKNVVDKEYPSYFVQALIGRLAAELCLPLTENTSRYELLLKQATYDLQIAKTVDSQQATPRGLEEFPLIQARFR